MFFYSNWFSPIVLQTAALVCAVLLALSAARAWQSIRQRPQACGTALLLIAFLWMLQAEVSAGHLAGMSYRLLGLNLACLMLGSSAAFWIGAVLMLPFAWLHSPAALSAVPLNILAAVLPACAFNALIRRFAAARLPPHLFVYIFVNGFLAAAAGMLLTGAAVCILLWQSGVFSGGIVRDSAFPVFFLLSWGEAFLTGIFTAVFVALLPQLLATFNDQRYLTRNTEIWK